MSPPCSKTSVGQPCAPLHRHTRSTAAGARLCSKPRFNIHGHTASCSHHTWATVCKQCWRAWDVCALRSRCTSGRMARIAAKSDIISMRRVVHLYWELKVGVRSALMACLVACTWRKLCAKQSVLMEWCHLWYLKGAAGKPNTSPECSTWPTKPQRNHKSAYVSITILFYQLSVCSTFSSSSHLLMFNSLLCLKVLTLV